MVKRLTYRTIVDDAREQGLPVVDKGYGRYEIGSRERGLKVYFGKTSWAFRWCDDHYHRTPRCRLEDAYAYLRVSPGAGLFPRERYLMRSAMGLLYERKPYRNHFLNPPQGEDFDVWMGLCARGLAVMGDENEVGRWFYVTREGAAANGVTLKEEDVPAPVPKAA